MAYYECLSNNDHIINIGDNFIVTLTGSHNLTTTATVCYISKTTVCLLGDISLGLADFNTQCNYAWNYTVNINNKKYTGTCRIPTFEQIHSKCARYKRDFNYWTSTVYTNGLSCWYVRFDGGLLENGGSDYSNYTLPFIEITL